MSTDVEPTGLISGIQRYSLHDGPGIRTLVFFKGCPLNCRWCCNPETQSRDVELMFHASRCIGCGKCQEVCPRKSASGTLPDLAECRGCAECAAVCPAGARVAVGRQVSVDEVLREVEKDQPFYQRSGGGVTLGGGEPCCQARFAEALLSACKARGFNTAIETSGYCSRNDLLQLVALADHVFMDIKHMDPVKHQEFTGVDNRLILENARRAAQQGGNLIIRTPVVPSFNDTPEEIGDIADFVRGLGSHVSMELLPFHALGEAKYRALGRTYDFRDVAPPDDNVMRDLTSVVSSCGVRIRSPKALGERGPRGLATRRSMPSCSAGNNSGPIHEAATSTER